jgi:hypothetical protein
MPARAANAGQAHGVAPALRAAAPGSATGTPAAASSVQASDVAWQGAIRPAVPTWQTETWATAAALAGAAATATAAARRRRRRDEGDDDQRRDAGGGAADGHPVDPITVECLRPQPPR